MAEEKNLEIMKALQKAETGKTVSDNVRELCAKSTIVLCKEKDKLLDELYEMKEVLNLEKQKNECMK